jgi:hypothetical protein
VRDDADKGFCANGSFRAYHRITHALADGYAEATLATYGAGLKLFSDICDTHGIPENTWFLVTKDLLAMFLAQLVGAYSGSAAWNYVAGLRVWHVVHCLPWTVDKQQMSTLLQAATLRAPPISHQFKKKPYTTEVLSQIVQQLSPNVALDATVASAATILFYALGCIDELTVLRQDGFREDQHVQISSLTHNVNRYWNRVMSIHIPHTKVSVTGETVCWAKQEGPTDPNAALANHC